MSPKGGRSLIQRVWVIWSLLLTGITSIHGSSFFLISQFIQLASCPWMVSHPPTATRPPWFVVWTCHFLSSVSVICVMSPICTVWWCRQEWHLSVGKENSDAYHPQQSAWLQVAVSACLLWPHFGFLICVTGSTFHDAVSSLALEPGLDQRERQNKDWIFPG